MSEPATDTGDLPPDLIANNFERKGSVLADLMTIFRRTPSKVKKYHARRPSSNKEQKLGLINESEAFLSADGTSGGVLGHEDEEDENKPMTRQVLLDKIRQKKEVIGKLRCQPWSMTRKRRTLRLAQKYLEQHESRVSKTHLFKEDLKKRWHSICRWSDNIKIYLIPWEAKIKTIESHFGSVVSSYFTFLRWVIFVNLVISLIIVSFVVIPEVLADAAADEGRKNRSETRKRMPESVREVADSFTVVWDYNGHLKYSPLFYGYYSSDRFASPVNKYNIPLSYFIITLFIFGYSFFAILKKMAANARLSKMAGSKAEQYVFNWNVFTGWDYTIGNPDAASNTVMAIIIKLRESIAECKVAKVKQFRSLLFLARVFANVVIILMLAFSIYCISFAVRASTTVEITGTKFNKNQVPAIVSTITHVFPMIFDLIGKMEKYHPRTALRAHLTRVLVLYMLNYMTLIISLFDKINEIQGTDTADDVGRFIRQLGGRNPYISRPPPFASRNFVNRSQAQAFLNKSLNRFASINTSTEFPKITNHYRPISNTTKNAKNATVQILTRTSPIQVSKPFVLLKDEFNGTTGAKTTKIATSESRPKGWNDMIVGNGTPTADTSDPKEKVKDPVKYILTYNELGEPVVQPANDTFIDLEFSNTAILTENATAMYLNGTEVKFAEKRWNKTDSAIVCWETMIGQELVKLVTMDLIITIASILIIDFFRGLWIRYCSSWWCWDIETTFPEYGEFKVAENVLHIINNQGMVWLGLFFAPMLPVLNNVKMIVLLYIRAWACMTCNVPAREIFRASRSSNFYLWILLLWLLLCTVPVFWVFASKPPSTDCGPFAYQERYYNVVTDMLEKHKTTRNIFEVLKGIASPGIVIPTLLLLLIIIYFLVSLVRGLREANNDLQQQLFHERTEEKKKIFELAGGGTKKKSDALRPEKKKKVVSYLPTVEQKRREPWRMYNGRDDDSACVSDQTSDSVTHTTRTQSPSVPSRAKAFLLSSFSKDSSTDVESGTKKNGKTAVRRLSKMASATSERTDNWSNQEVRSDQSFDVENGVVQLASQEEIKSLTPVFATSRNGSFVLPQIDAQQQVHKYVFPTCKTGSSRRCSKELSDATHGEYIGQPMFINNTNESYLNACSFPSVGTTEPTIHQKHPERTEKIELDAIKCEHKSRKDTDKTPSKRHTLQRQNCIRKNEITSTSTDFCSWPSPDEVKEENERKTTNRQLHPTPAPRARSHEKPQKQPSEQKPETSAVGIQQRRFRISVSPTHRYRRTDPSGSDTDTSTGKRRYMIKQEVMLDSVHSGSTQNSSQVEHVSPPRVPDSTFREEDSTKAGKKTHDSYENN